MFTLPPRENWFQYVHRVYETAINFPYITALYYSSFIFVQGRVDSETSDYSDSSGMTEYNRGARNKNNFLTFEF